MKSIELSEEAYKELTESIRNTLYTKEEKKQDRLLGYLKPIEPIEQKWSEGEIRGDLERDEWGPTAIDRIINTLKTPKSEMREMNASELSEWLCTLGTLWDVLKLEWRHIGSAFVYTAKALENNTEDEKEYRLTPNAPWLPIPQIEKEK